MEKPISARWLILVLVHSGLIQAGVYVVRPMMSYQSVNLGADATTVGLIGATFALAPLVFAIQIGRWVDKGLAGMATFLGSLVALLVAISLVFADQLWQIALLLPLLGIGHLLAMVGEQTLIAQFSKDAKYEKNFGLLTFYASLGQAAGPFVGGFLAQSEGSRAVVAPAIWFAALLFFGAALVTLSIRNKLPSVARPKGDRALTQVLRVPGYKPAIFVAGTTTAVVDVILIYLPLLGTAVGLSVAEVGALLAIRAVASMLVRYVLGSLGTRYGVKVILVAGSFVTFLGVLAITLATNFVWLAILLFITGIAMGIGQPATMAWVSRISSPENRGLAISVRLTANRLGQVAIPVVAGSLATFGLSAIFYLLSGLMLMATAVSFRWAPGPGTKD